jgi:hypothetical protein
MCDLVESNQHEVASFDHRLDQLRDPAVGMQRSEYLKPVSSSQPAGTLADNDSESVRASCDPITPDLRVDLAESAESRTEETGCLFVPTRSILSAGKEVGPGHGESATQSGRCKCDEGGLPPSHLPTLVVQSDRSTVRKRVVFFTGFRVSRSSLFDGRRVGRARADHRRGNEAFRATRSGRRKATHEKRRGYLI